MTVPYDGEYLRDPRQPLATEIRKQFRIHGGVTEEALADAVANVAAPIVMAHAPAEMAVEATKPGGETSGAAKPATADLEAFARPLKPACGCCRDFTTMQTVHKVLWIERDKLAALRRTEAEADRLREAVKRVRELCEPIIASSSHHTTVESCDELDAILAEQIIQALGEEA